MEEIAEKSINSVSIETNTEIKHSENFTNSKDTATANDDSSDMFEELDNSQFDNFAEESAEAVTANDDDNDDFDDLTDSQLLKVSDESTYLTAKESTSTDIAESNADPDDMFEEWTDSQMEILADESSNSSTKTNVRSKDDVRELNDCQKQEFSSDIADVNNDSDDMFDDDCDDSELIEICNGTTVNQKPSGKDDFCNIV